MLNAAIVGLGWWGQTLVESVSGNSEKIRFVRAVSRSASETAKEFSKLHKMNLVRDFDAVLADPKIVTLGFNRESSSNNKQTQP